MAKKKTSGPKRTKQTEGQKVAMQLRVDSDLYGGLKAAAEESGISLNQLIQGMCRGCLAHLVQGEPNYVGKLRLLGRRPQRECVFFGKLGERATEADKGAAAHGLLEPEEGEDDLGNFWFALDYSGRGVRY